MIPQLQGVELRQYQTHVQEYMRCKAAKWDPVVLDRASYLTAQDQKAWQQVDQTQAEWNHLEALAQKAWKVCARILLKHGISKKQIKQIKKEAKNRSREKFFRKTQATKNVRTSNYESYAWEE